MARKGPRHKKRNAGAAFDVEPERKKPRLFVVNTGLDSLSQLQHTGNPNPKREGRYTNSDNILLIGEGNFSFALALATSIGGRKIWATSYDTELEVRQKYESAGNILRGIRAMGVTVAHGVDAQDLAQAEPVKGLVFDKIVFNFPHIGGGTAEDADANKAMLAAFFKQALLMLGKGGEVHVALRRTPFYDSWGVAALAEEAGLALAAEEAFAGARFKALGYTPQRTNPAVREAPSLDNAVLYVFTPDTSHAPVMVQAGALTSDSFGAALRKGPPASTAAAAEQPRLASAPTKAKPEAGLQPHSFGSALKKPQSPNKGGNAAKPDEKQAKKAGGPATGPESRAKPQVQPDGQQQNKAAQKRNKKKKKKGPAKKI